MTRPRGVRHEDPAGLAALVGAAAAAASISLAARQIEALGLHLATLLAWRERLALVSQRDPAEIASKHLEDCLHAAPHLPAGARVADLGSGAGFPGLVLAVARPDVEVTLVEAQRRKASFLREVVRVAAIGNASIVESRVEDLDGPAAGPFDLVIARAVWTSAEFFARARPLLGPGGLAVAMKTAGEAELCPVGYQGVRRHPYRLSQGEARLLLVAQAECST